MTKEKNQKQRLGFMAIPVDSPVFKGNDDKLLRIYLYLKARSRRYESKLDWKGEVLILEPGDFIFGRYAVSKETGIPPTTCRDKLYKLKDMGIVVKVRDLIGASLWKFLDNPPQEEQPIEDVDEPSSKPEPKPQKKIQEKPHYKPLSKGKTERGNGFATGGKADVKPVSGSTAAINPDLRSLYVKKTTIPPKKWICSEDDVVVSSPLILQADKTGALQRFADSSTDFLQWLLEQAKKIARINAIGLLLHWLKTGKMNAIYADIVKNRIKQQKSKERQALEEKRKREEEKQKQNQRLIELAEKRRQIESSQERRHEFALDLQKAQRSKHAGFLLRNLGLEQVLDDLDALELVLGFGKIIQEERSPQHGNLSFAV